MKKLSNTGAPFIRITLKKIGRNKGIKIPAGPTNKIIALFKKSN
jgi:hypothetical protein